MPYTITLTCECILPPTAVHLREREGYSSVYNVHCIHTVSFTSVPMMFTKHTVLRVQPIDIKKVDKQ